MYGVGYANPAPRHDAGAGVSAAITAARSSSGISMSSCPPLPFASISSWSRQPAHRGWQMPASHATAPEWAELIGERSQLTRLQTVHAHIASFGSGVGLHALTRPSINKERRYANA